MKYLYMLGFVGWVAGGCDGDGPPAGPPPAWSRTLPPAAVMGAHRGLIPARGIVHLHSPYSHDACDGMPRGPNDNGPVDEVCLDHLRKALCDTAMDFAALTDHDDTMADEDWGPELFLKRGADELVVNATGAPTASRLACDTGRKVLLFVGGENDLMPIMLDQHPEGDAGTRHAVYNGNDVDTVNAYRALGGLAWVAHSESKEIGLLRELKLDGMEVYNLHAAIDADIRMKWLNLSPDGAVQAAADFLSPEPTAPEPDLALVAFLDENLPSVHKWETLLGEGNRVAATAGTDAHENAIALLMRDGERVDSYRRMMRWFANVVLVALPSDPAQIEQAMATGRLYVAFEVLGTPTGFDARADKADGTIAELGAELRVADGATLVVETPSVYMLSPALPEPLIRTRILRVDAAGSTEVAAGAGRVTAAADQPGAYRVEVRMTPRHLAPYMTAIAAKGFSEREYVWIYASPIYVRP